MYIPYVIEKSNQGERSYDIYSRLLEDRIIMLCGEIDDNLASSVVSQLLFLAATDSEKDISLYINSPGGSISAGMAIVDTMNLIKPDEYIKYLLERLDGTKQSEIKTLLPWSDKIPQEMKYSKRDTEKA